MSRTFAVIDIDGVLADVRHRLHHLRSRPKNWAGFFANLGDDPPYAEGIALAHKLAEDHDIVYLSGRPERTRSMTEAWLSAHDLPAGPIVLRPDNDRRPARVFKLGALKRLAADRPIDIVVDDDLKVCEVVKSAGFTVFQADWGDENPTLHDAQENHGRT